MKAQQQRRASGVIWNALGSAMFGINSLIMLSAVNRATNVETAGTFGIAYTSAQLLFILGVFGANHYQMTDYAHAYAFKTYHRLKVFSSAAMLPCALIVYLLGLGGNSLFCLMALTVLMMLNAWGELYQSLFFQHDRLDLSGKALFYRTLATSLAFIAVLAVPGAGLNEALLLACVVNPLTTWYFDIRLTPTFSYEATDDRGVMELAKTCAPLFLSVFLMNLLLSMPKYGIQLLMDDVAQGYFNLIFMPVQVINICSQFIFKPMLGQYAQMLENRRIGPFVRLICTQTLLMLGITLAACVGAWWLGPPVLGLIYGTSLTHLRAELTWLIFGSGIFALCQLAYYMLVILRKNAQILCLYVVNTVIAVLVSAWLIPRWGLLGASLSFGLSHGVLLLCYIWQIIRQLRRRAL